MDRHTHYDLAQMQSVPLEGKIIMTQERIRQWYEHWGGQVYVSFSGGKDSTVLKHIVDSMYDDVPALFVNTGLEYPEIQRFAMSQTNVVTVRPEMRFDEVIKTYGYPVISREIAQRVYYAQRGSNWAIQCLNGRNPDGTSSAFKQRHIKWRTLVDAPFRVSHKCCDIMKKHPAKRYEKETGRKPFVGTLAGESIIRRTRWIRHGCNAFEGSRPTSQPLSFWTENDILQYIAENKLPYASVYGEITKGENGYSTTGCNRTGCTFCMFGCHLEKEPNRFQRLKETHPRQYAYCIGGGEMVDGNWQPNREGLGLGRVLDYIGVDYGRPEKEVKNK